MSPCVKNNDFIRALASDRMYLCMPRKAGRTLAIKQMFLLDLVSSISQKISTGMPIPLDLAEQYNSLVLEICHPGAERAAEYADNPIFQEA